MAELSGEEKTYYPRIPGSRQEPPATAPYFEITAGDAFLEVKSDQGCHKCGLGLCYPDNRLMNQYEQQSSILLFYVHCCQCKHLGIHWKRNPDSGDLLALQKIKFNGLHFLQNISRSGLVGQHGHA